MSSAPAERRRPSSATVVVCLPGIEALVVAELAALGVRGRVVGTGTVAARMTPRQLYAANLHLACATRVLVEVGTITARSFATLEQRAPELDLAPFRAPGQPVRMRVTSHRSRLHHTGAVEERLRRALDLGPAPAPDDPDAALLVARLDRDRLAVRADSSGAPLHHRGWRGPAGKAPLRETLAAAALQGVGWEPGQPLVDPCAGSGTIPIEAARAAAGIAPGADRGFAFQRWPSFAPGTWASVRSTAQGDPAPPAPILARDRDAGAVTAIGENAARGRVADRVTVEPGAVSSLVPPPAAARPGWVLTNPPWGGRLAGGKGGDVRDLYARLGQVVAERFPEWGLAVLVPDVRLAHAAGVTGEPVWRSRAGPTPVLLMARPPGRATPGRTAPGQTTQSRAISDGEGVKPSRSK